MYQNALVGALWLVVAHAQAQAPDAPSPPSVVDFSLSGILKAGGLDIIREQHDNDYGCPTLIVYELYGTRQHMEFRYAPEALGTPLGAGACVATHWRQNGDGSPQGEWIEIDQHPSKVIPPHRSSLKPKYYSGGNYEYRWNYCDMHLPVCRAFGTDANSAEAAGHLAVERIYGASVCYFEQDTVLSRSSVPVTFIPPNNRRVVWYELASDFPPNVCYRYFDLARQFRCIGEDDTAWQTTPWDGSEPAPGSCQVPNCPEVRSAWLSDCDMKGRFVGTIFCPAVGLLGPAAAYSCGVGLYVMTEYCHSRAPTC